MNECKYLFDCTQNLSHLTLYPDVLEIKTIIVEKQNLAKMPFAYYKKITNPFLTTLQLGRPGNRVARLWICKFVINKQMAFLQIFVFTTITYCFHFQNIWIQCQM